MTACEIVFALICFVLIVTHYFERRSLLNRIMAKNLAEYKSTKAHYVPSAHKKVLDRWRTKDGGDIK